MAVEATDLQEQFQTLEGLDGFAELRRLLKHVAARDDDWAGIPMPLKDFNLVVEPSYPMKERLKAMTAIIKGEDADKPTESFEEQFPKHRSFYSSFRRSQIHIWEKDGKVHWGAEGLAHGVSEQLHTLGASVAWGIEQEHNAVRLLATLLPHHAFKMYLMTGAFLESSARSHVTYMFRRLRPTVAMHDNGGKMKILCSLCLHPIAYYAGSWAGAMCPTDDVVAHLMLMRANEPLYWRRSNQHPAYHPSAGL